MVVELIRVFKYLALGHEVSGQNLEWVVCNVYCIIQTNTMYLTIQNKLDIVHIHVIIYLWYQSQYKKQHTLPKATQIKTELYYAYRIFLKSILEFILTLSSTICVLKD